eukprot:CAMPEP_0183707842 /NCGR_PEP_ID=MMETSP0737-20130205/4282_1 /TAXON_ID=385413 /ORGANISM="Thalassiosira miniscula, Strain CCMP1093" /LENGTH=280 /DNA_ID=CAMNT_0025935573 /DNA_START=31 /DNA_END=873 /DNA_ORIENTATION=+
MMISKVSRLCLHRNGLHLNTLPKPSATLVTERSLGVSATLHAHAPIIKPTTAANANTHFYLPHHHPHPSFHPKHHKNNSLQSSSFSTRTRRRRRQGGGAPSSYNPVEGGPGNSSAADEKPASASSRSPAKLSSAEFLSVANTLLDRVESSLTKLKDVNDGLEITRHPPFDAPEDDDASDATAENEDDDDENNKPKAQSHSGQLSIRVESSGDLYWGGGTYLVTISGDDRGVVTLQSPLSGNFAYVYDGEHDEWVGEEDGHSMLGMLTRDWIRQCRGVPDF